MKKLAYSKNCAICKTTFRSSFPQAKFCSIACFKRYSYIKRGVADLKRRQEEREHKLCVVCGYSIIKALEKHHISPEETITLCASCHTIWHRLSLESYSTKDKIIDIVSNHLLKK